VRHLAGNAISNTKGAARIAGANRSLTALYLTYGVIGGAGLGLGYIVPIAVLVR
jgi:OFA family oxalate/formate antiporter-like MFS transporter